MATWPAPERLPAQRLQRAAHPEEETEGEVGDDGEVDSHRGQLAVDDVAREDLCRGVGAVQADDVEGDGRADRPQHACVVELAPVCLSWRLCFS